MTLAPGTRIGPYEVTAQIGVGGMGEVYLARDTKLKRDVALKVLPVAFAEDGERLARFQREAEALAALNHPNIAQIYGFENRAIVMELVPGATLAERIAAGPLPLDEALGIARQIAEALEAAHDRGIVHRDLKPANIKITPEGVVKVLDFGLATAVQSTRGPAVDPDNSPTLTMGPDPSLPGMIVGTASYMSPEQASGRAVDRRADIWSFGVVLWEMLARRRLFEGETVSHTLADVLRSEIPFAKVSAPAPVLHLLRRCLDRDPKTRLRDIGEARVAIASYLAKPDVAEQSQPARRFAWTYAVVAALALVAAGAWLRAPSPEPRRVLQVEITPPAGVRIGPIQDGQTELSPDGRMIVFPGTPREGRRVLWLRSLETGAVRPLPGTEEPGIPFWSPDSQWIAFPSRGKLYKVDIQGGQPIPVADTNYRYGSWGENGEILMVLAGARMQRIPAEGGKPVELELDATLGETSHNVPRFLRGGRSFFYISPSKGIVWSPLDAKNRRVVTTDRSSSPIDYARDPDGGGWAIYSLATRLFARRFDAGTGEFTGEAQPIAEGLGNGPKFSVSDTGLVAYRRVAQDPARLVWITRDGREAGVIPESARASVPRISPDGTRVAFTRDSETWMHDTSRGVSARFAPGGRAVWLPDGTGILTDAVRDDVRVSLEVPANGGRETVAWRGSSRAAGGVESIARNGRCRAMRDGPAYYLLCTGGKPVLHNDRGSSATSESRLSPDGRWLLYEGAGPEIIVAAVPPEAGGSPKASGRFQISVQGGTQPQWRADGREIFYVGSGGEMTAVPVESSTDVFRAGVPTVLFDTQIEGGGLARYDVSPDGQRFVIAQPPADAADTPITVIVNWPQLLKARTPTDAPR